MLSSDHDFTEFLASIRLEDVIWEGYATATHLQRRLWESKLKEKKASAA